MSSVNCEKCNHTYSSISSLSHHKKVCKGEEDVTFKYEKVTLENLALTKELDKVKLEKLALTKKLDKVKQMHINKCNFCTKTFISTANVSVHMKVCRVKADYDIKIAKLEEEKINSDIKIATLEEDILNEKTNTEEIRKLVFTNNNLVNKYVDAMNSVEKYYTNS